MYILQIITVSITRYLLMFLCALLLHFLLYVLYKLICMLLLCIESKTINKIKISAVVIFVLTLNSDALNVLNLVSSRFQKRLLTKIIKNELELFTDIKN